MVFARPIGINCLRRCRRHLPTLYVPLPQAVLSVLREPITAHSNINDAVFHHRYPATSSPFREQSAQHEPSRSSQSRSHFLRISFSIVRSGISLAHSYMCVVTKNLILGALPYLGLLPNPTPLPTKPSRRYLGKRRCRWRFELGFWPLALPLPKRHRTARDPASSP
jgi:hypothetical protein